MSEQAGMPGEFICEHALRIKQVTAASGSKARLRPGRAAAVPDFIPMGK